VNHGHADCILKTWVTARLQKAQEPQPGHVLSPFSADTEGVKSNEGPELFSGTQGDLGAWGGILTREWKVTAGLRV
jgi:hypothetical protein